MDQIVRIKKIESAGFSRSQVLQFFIAEQLALTKTDSPHFRLLFSRMSDYKPPCRQTLTSRLPKFVLSLRKVSGLVGNGSCIVFLILTGDAGRHRKFSRVNSNCLRYLNFCC